MKSYLFDTMLTAALRIEANSEQEAREQLTAILDCATVIVTSGINPEFNVTGEASGQGELELAEVSEVQS